MFSDVRIQRCDTTASFDIVDAARSSRCSSSGIYSSSLVSSMWNGAKKLQLIKPLEGEITAVSKRSGCVVEFEKTLWLLSLYLACSQWALSLQVNWWLKLYAASERCRYRLKNSTQVETSVHAFSREDIWETSRGADQGWTWRWEWTRLEVMSKLYFKKTVAWADCWNWQFTYGTVGTASLVVQLEYNWSCILLWCSDSIKVQLTLHHGMAQWFN